MLFQYIVIYVASFIGLFSSLVFLLTLFENKEKMKNPTPTKFPFVSILIPAYNEEENIAKTIQSVQELEYSGKYEIIVIDDGSKDNTFKIASRIAKNDPRVRVITQENKGKAAAVNHGIRLSKGEFVATLDADSFVEKDALMKMIGYLEDKRVVSVTPSMKVYEPKTVMQKIQKVEYLWGIFLRKIFSFMNALHVTPGPFSIYRKAFFEKYGGFDEHNLTEDTEIALRIQSHHYKIENSIDATVYTVSPKTFGELLKQRTRWYYGLIKNLKMYPQLFNPRYGYVAVFSLPAAIVSILTIVFVTVYFGVLMIRSLIQNFANWNAVGFDFLTVLSEFKLSYLYYQLTSPITAIILIMALFNIVFLIYAELKSKEKKMIDTAYIYYFCFYAYIYAFWWIAAVFAWIFGKIRWKELHYD